MATTGLIESALYARAYLMFLSPYHAMEGERSFWKGIQFISFVLIRIEEKISEVVDGFNKDHGRDDKRYWSEVAIALAILYYGLHHAQEALEDPTTQPICNDPQLVCLLVERMESVKARLNNLLHPQNLSCDPEWASALEGSLEDLQSNAKISFLSIKTMKQAVPLSQWSPSSSSFGSTSILTTQTSPSSIMTTPSGDLDTLHFDTSIDNGWHGTSHGPSLDPSGKMPTQLYEFQGINIIKSSSNSSDMIWGQNMSSPFPMYPYGNTIDKSEYPTSLTTDTSHANSYGIFTLPQPIPNLQVPGMSLDVPSEKGESHVSRPLPYAYDERPLDWTPFRTCSLRFDRSLPTFPSTEEKPLIGFWQ